MDPSTFVAPLAGGALIGLAAAAVLLGPGRIAGASTILATVVDRDGPEPWKLAFLGGLVAVGVVTAIAWPAGLATTHVASPATLVAAGLLVGFGTRTGGGCTSGHGVCGNARGAPRSIVATLTFIATGMLAVGAVRWAGGGA